MARISEDGKTEADNAPFLELVRLMRVQRDAGQGVCLFLGAGCSLSSSAANISTTSIVRRYLSELSTGVDFSERGDDENFRQFANSWMGLGTSDRHNVLSRLIPEDLEPSIGYTHVARLAAAGYVKAIITTNFDNLIDKALQRANVSYEFYCGRQPSTNPMGKRASLVLAKLHGGLHQCELSFSPDALDHLPRALKTLVQKLSAMPLLVAGYSGQDRSVMTALSTARGHTAFWSSPNEPKRSERARNDRIFSWLDKRVPKGAAFLSGSSYGDFDGLFKRLSTALEKGGAPPVGVSTFC